MFCATCGQDDLIDIEGQLHYKNSKGHYVPHKCPVAKTLLDPDVRYRFLVTTPDGEQSWTPSYSDPRCDLVLRRVAKKYLQDLTGSRYPLSSEVVETAAKCVVDAVERTTHNWKPVPKEEWL